MTSLFALLVSLFAPAQAQSCGELAPLPAATQVAWISRSGRRVWGRSELEVVRVTDLRAWLRDHPADSGRLVQALGMAPRRGGRAARVPYKITIFDVQSDWLCRPVEGAALGAELGGVLACEERDARPTRHHRKGFTGCGYSLDTASSQRGLDVMRVRWADASSWGFCVMPLDRFISGA